MICIYHSRDLDGYASGAIVKRKYPDAKLIGFDYGQALPIEQIPEGVEVIMIDVSLPMAEMRALAVHTGYKLTWIDHHVSAIKAYEQYIGDGDHFLTAILKDGIAACEIGWNFLFPGQMMPTAIKLLGEYDTWRNQDEFRWNNAIMPFQYGMREICISAETFPAPLFEQVNPEDGPVYSIINSGKTILSYTDKQNERLCKLAAFEAVFMGYRCICVNQGGASSLTFKSVYDEDKHDIMMPFFFNGEQWSFSIYTTKDTIDCSMLARQMGGGGHKKAAGFQQDTFDLFTSSKGI